MSRYKEYHQNQIMLMPPSLEDKIEQDHLARYINRLVEALDIHEIEEGYFDIGCKAYHPRMLLKILIYGYSVGLRSSRRIHRATREDVVFMWLAGLQEPDFRTISDFRKGRVKDIKVIFKQVLNICRELDMVKCGKISIDGTKLEANSSRNKITYRKNLERRQDKYEEQVDQMLQEADELDAEEDKLYGDKDGYSMDRALSDEEIKKAIQKVKQRKDKLQRKSAKAKAKIIAVNDKIERMGEKRNSFGNTDPDATLMLMKEGHLGVGYNVQMATENQVILAYGVYQNRSDVHLLKPMIEAIEVNMGTKPAEITADKGYCSQSNYEYVYKQEIVAAIPPQTYDFDMAARRQGSYQYSKNWEYEKLKVGMLDFLETEEGLQLMERRKNDIEPTFGDIKYNMGFRKFLLRNKAKVSLEVGLIALAHNIKKIKKWLDISELTLLQVNIG